MWPFSSVTPDVSHTDAGIRNRDIILGDEVYRQRTRWTRLLIFYLRGLAMFSLVRGLTDWSRILGFIGAEGAFESAPLTWQVTLSLYAVLNCVASVGLWLTSAWGAVLWLIVTFCEILLPWLTDNPVGPSSPLHGVMGGMVLLYIILTAVSARERNREH
jgi:cellulose synthase/poly-beta-1,6-N-acetylglucosamine synthase-like glycosyltransferase